jgi:hypothetical protein
MQLPSRCGVSADILDTHPVMDLQGTSDTYTFAAECSGITQFSVDGVPTGPLGQNSPIHNWGFNDADPHVVSVSNDNARFLQLFRTLPSFGGSILSPALSVKQYITSVSIQFFAPLVENNFVQIIADPLAVATSTLDLVSLADQQWRLVPVLNGYMFSMFECLA